MIVEHWRANGDGNQALAEALAHAAGEAHAQGLRPEELILEMKAIEQDVMGRPDALRGNDPDARRRFREWLVSACLKAYFAP